MIARRAGVAALLLLAFVLAPHARAEDRREVKLVTAKPGGPVAVHITGIEKATLAALAEAKLTAEEWPKVARLVVDSGTLAEAAKKPPIAGDWSVKGDALVFDPQFPLVPGRTYRVLGDLGAAPRTKLQTDSLSLPLSIPKPPPGPRVQVLRVDPSANRIPENTLRFYVHFSGQVKHGDVYSRFKLTRDDGTVISRPFVELDEELWSDDGTRLTLIFDPGRVKRGLGPREEFGPILEEGRTYTFTVDASWPDAEGRPLLTIFKRTFTTTAPDDEPVWPDDWKMIAPRAGSDSPLMVRLSKPLDRAQLKRMLWVVDGDGKRAEGTLSVGLGERVVSFTPAKPWTKGNYKLMIDANLEDLCGNRVGEPFEVDVLKPIPLKPVQKIAERTFAVK